MFRVNFQTTHTELSTFSRHSLKIRLLLGKFVSFFSCSWRAETKSVQRSEMVPWDFGTPRPRLSHLSYGSHQFLHRNLQPLHIFHSDKVAELVTEHLSKVTVTAAQDMAPVCGWVLPRCGALRTLGPHGHRVRSRPNQEGRRSSTDLRDLVKTSAALRFSMRERAGGLFAFVCFLAERQTCVAVETWVDCPHRSCPSMDLWR